MKKGRDKFGRYTAKPKRKPRGIGRPFQKGPDDRRNTAGQRSKAAVETTKKIRAELLEEGDRQSTCTIIMPDGKIKTFKDKNYKLLARIIWQRAINGDYQFASMLLERIEGKVPQSLQGGDDDKPVLLKIVPAAGGKG